MKRRSLLLSALEQGAPPVRFSWLGPDQLINLPVFQYVP